MREARANKQIHTHGPAQRQKKKCTRQRSRSPKAAFQLSLVPLQPCCLRTSAHQPQCSLRGTKSKGPGIRGTLEWDKGRLEIRRMCS